MQQDDDSASGAVWVAGGGTADPDGIDDAFELTAEVRCMHVLAASHVQVLAGPPHQKHSLGGPLGNWRDSMLISACCHGSPLFHFVGKHQ